MKEQCFIHKVLVILDIILKDKISIRINYDVKFITFNQSFFKKINKIISCDII